MTSVIINGKDYSKYAQLGLVLTDWLSEELDSITIILNDVEQTAFTPFDEVNVVLPNQNLATFSLVTSAENIFDYENSTYTYTINAVSKTKILERVPCPNLKIRKGIKNNFKPLGDYLNNVVMKYVNRQYPNIKIAKDVIDYLNDFDCPEMEWQTPNAKQVFNDLLSTIGGNPCLAKIVGNDIKLLSLAKEGNSISNYSSIKILDNSNHQDMSNFADNVVMDARNIIQTNVTPMCEWVSPRTEESLELTTDNASIVLSNPIYDLKKVLLKASIEIKEHDSGNTIVNGERNINITKYVLEEADYKSQSQNLLGGNKYEVLYYKQGGKTINGLGANNKFLFLNGVDALKKIIMKALSVELYGNEDYYIGMDWSCSIKNDVRGILFYIEYLTTTDARISIYKDEPTDKNIAIYQTQNQAQVDMTALSRQVRETANRLGNEIKELPMICDLNDVPQLGDVYQNDYILCKREVAYYYDFAIVNAMFVKNYAQKNLYYGVKNKKKYTQLAQANESVVREEHRRISVNFSTNATPQGFGLDSYIASYFSGAKNPIKVMAIITDAMDDFASLYPTILSADRSVIVTAQMYDNYAVGRNTFLKGATQYQGYVKYVDVNGEFKLFGSVLYGGFKSDIDNIQTLRAMPNADIGNNILFYEDSIPFYKDNGEIFKLTYQFDFISESDDLIMGDMIGTNNIIVGADFSKFKLAYSIGKKVDKQYPTIPSNAVYNTSAKVVVTNNRIKITDIDLVSSVTSWMLVDDDGNILLAVNRDIYGDLKTEIYITAKGERN